MHPVHHMRGAWLLLILLLPSPAAALDPQKAITQYLHSVWHAEDGLPQNTVTAIAQTPDGFLWLGTRAGLARFDGIRFTVFNSDNTPALRQSQILSLLTDRHGQLWIGTWGGGVTTLAHGQFTRYSTEQGLPDELITAIVEDSAGKIWVGTDGGGVAGFESGRFMVPVLPETGRHVRALAANAEGVWVGSDRGLTLIAPNGQAHTFAAGQGLTQPSVRSLRSSRSGGIWIGTDHGLFRLKNGSISGYPESSPLAHDLVLALAEDADGSLWIGSDARGLRRLAGARLDTYTSKEGLSNDSIYSLFEDRERNLWVGTNVGGLNRFRDGKITAFGQSEGLASEVTRAVFQSSDGSLWVGTEGGGIDRIANGRITHFTTRDGLSNDTVFSIAEDPAGAIWIGTDSGLSRIANSRVVSVTRDTIVANESILALEIARDGTIWMGTYASGLVRFRDGVFTVYNTAGGFPHNTVNVIHEARDGTLWIGTRGGGLTRYRDGAFTTFATKEGLAGDLVFSIHEDSDGTLWIGTYGGGLSRLRDGQFSSVTHRLGLFDDVIHRIIDDGAGRFWISTNRGIFSVLKTDLDAVASGSKPGLASESYGVLDGMRNVECNGGASAGARTRDGRIWFPTIAGLVSFLPAAMHAAVAPPPVVIEDVAVDGVARDVSSGLTLQPVDQTLAVNFTALNLATPEATRFRYRLDGLETAWVESGTRRTAYYSKLPPGQYVFHVTAANGDSGWSEPTATLTFAVAPNWYETLWFRAAIAAALLLIGALLYQVRLRSLTAQTAALERQVAERTAELAAANQRLVLLAQEDGLTGLLNRRAFDEALDTECRRSARAKTPVALLLIDIDHFKAYNDRLGHQAGDACLRSVATAVRQGLRRAGEIVARYGGEEFAVILPGADRNAAMESAEHVRKVIQDLALPHPAAVSGIVTASIGVSATGAGADFARDALIAAADRSLYRAKADGRNRVHASDD